MVREVITVCVGQAGNQIGYSFWEKACLDHQIAPDGKFVGNKKDKVDKQRLDKINVFFEEASKTRYVPRSIFCDLEPGVHDKIRSRKLGKLFANDRFVHGVNGAGNCWAIGYFSEGSEIAPECMDELRKEFERCESPQAIQFIHSVGGGTGSGMGSLLLEKCQRSYPGVLRCDFTVYPSTRVSDTVVEPYNAMCSLPTLAECVDENFVLDNEAIYSISTNVTKAGKSHTELNNLVADAMLGVTSSLRFSGWLNCDLRKLGVNLVPFPRLHFFLLTEAPLGSAKSKKYESPKNLTDLCRQMLSKSHYFAQINTEKGKYMSIATLFRGDISSSAFEEETSKIEQGMHDDFVQWIPDHFKTASIRVPPPKSEISATFIGNTTSMKQLFVRIKKRFVPLFKRKAFLQTYKEHGMDEMMFHESLSNCKDLIQEYQDRQDATVDLDDPLGKNDNDEDNDGGDDDFEEQFG